MSWLIDLLRDPSVDRIDVDSTDRLIVHGKILARKRMLREVFTEFHHSFRSLDERFFSAHGARIELGAGIAPIRDSYSDVLATDVVYGYNLDRVLNAENLDLPDTSVRTIYGQNCFHHFPHPDCFFEELKRVLAPGGGAILLEPYYGPFATFLFKRLFRTEGFDKEFPVWETPAAGPMNGANQALSYLVFTRDRADFERKHPTLKIVHQELCGNHFKYLLSGGLNFRQLLPGWTSHLVDLFQLIFSPFNRWISLHHIIVIRKENP
jgi:SAM-dependent methyltransferase